MTDAPRSFEKWHGLGNDFVLVLDPDDPAWWRVRSVAICDRHRGVGADGVLLATSSPPAMEVINADGSRPEMCGNGLRCVAAALAERTGASELTIDTPAGVLACTIDLEGFVTYAAGMVSFEPQDAGVGADLGNVLHSDDARGMVASIGNPHWIFLGMEGVDELVARGPALEADPRFAKRTNVEFVRPLDDHGIAWRVDVWERGVGITKACGTGATAVAATLVREGLAPAKSPLRIELPGGSLEITVETDFRCRVRGPAICAFRGSLT
jgi:diaminopimelate epimerase